MTVTLGLTGSIGMGKSTTAQMFRDLGIPVWDADATVHALYQKDGAAVDQIGELCPGAIRTGAVDRSVLKEAIARDPDLLGKIEAVVHPLVAADRQAFRQARADHPVILFDIPLLFETGGNDLVDIVVVVSTDPQTQKARVLARPGMTEAQFDAILARQVPDVEKRSRADYVVETDTTEGARAQVEAILKDVMEQKHA